VTEKLSWFGRAASGGRALTAIGPALLLVFCGCAARHTGPSSRFIKPGQPPQSLGERVESAPQESLSDYASRLRKLQAEARPKSTAMATIESRDPALAAALLKLALQETAVNHRLVADAYRNAGVNDYAHRHLQIALRLDPCDAAAYDDLARLWRDWGLPQLALGHVYRALHCNPNAPGIYNTLGTVLQALGQPEQARTAFEHALQLDRGAAYAFNNLCYISLQSGDTASARRFCERALALEPKMAAAGNNLALALAIDGETARAEMRLLDSPDPARGHYNVGVLRMSLGRFTQAAEAFDLARSERPSLWMAGRRAAQARALAARMELNDVDR
jgi:Flp pilus assembly protein TadD